MNPMNTRKLTFRPYALCAAAALLFAACEKDDGEVAGGGAEGRLRVEMTDAPFDDAGVEGVFVTVAEVRIDGEVQPELSQRATFDLAAYSGGRTFTLGSDQAIRAGTMGDIEIVLDLQADANGQAPGCYVLRSDGTKDGLGFAGASQISIAARPAVSVAAEGTTRLVADVDLRKAITRERAGETAATFGSETRLNAGTRFVQASATGEVRGEIKRAPNAPATERLVVYAYAEGTFTASEDDGGAYANAYASATVGADGTFTLAFLPEGDYELVAVDYADEDRDGVREARARLATDAVLGLNIRQVSVSAQAQVSLELTIGALLP